jgi:hydroxyethylthiazole kinase-like uncharacterized protein yjeF
MKVVRADQMREIDRETQEEYGLSAAVLMERAALAVRDEIAAIFEEITGLRVIIACGKGNNGGDGLALARLLAETGAVVTVALCFAEKEYRGLAGENLALARKYGIVLRSWCELQESDLSQADLIVDALLGTGSKGAPEGAIAEAVAGINAAGIPVLAVDIPTGIEVDSGRVSGSAIQADWTVTFGLPKPGLLSYPAAECAGEVIVTEIGFPRPLLEAKEFMIECLTGPEVQAMLPQRPADAHKGLTGHLLIVGGLPGMTGAPALAALGGLRSGCGLATVALSPETAFPEKPLEVMVKSWPELAGRFSEFDCIVIGPGLGMSDNGLALLQECLADARTPLIIDADALNLLAANPLLFKKIKAPTILTPHPGELARLTGLSVAEIQSDRLQVAARFAVEHKTTLVLKGAGTVIAAPDGRLFINPTGNPGMATAGMGDVLSGIIGGLIVQGMEPLAAATAGVYLHGMAGDAAAEAIGQNGLIASDLLRELPGVLEKVGEDESA